MSNKILITKEQLLSENIYNLTNTMPKDFRKKYTTVGKQTTDKVKKLTTQPNDPLNMGARNYGGLGYNYVGVYYEEEESEVDKKKDNKKTDTIKVKVGDEKKDLLLGEKPIEEEYTKKQLEELLNVPSDTRDIIYRDKENQMDIDVSALNATYPDIIEAIDNVLSSLPEDEEDKSDIIAYFLLKADIKEFPVKYKRFLTKVIKN